VLVGEDAGKLREAMQQLNQGEWKQAQLPDRWDGRTAERIVKILME
jgi:UDP-N-acetylglucosamine 2-epimerase (non-hydrolysing)